MEGPIRPYQCLIYTNQGSPPYDIKQIPSYVWRASHTLVQIGLVFDDQDVDEEECVVGEREESVEL